MDVIKTADHVIDLGPEGGHAGGRIVVTGTPEDVARCKASHTGRFLKAHLQQPLIERSRQATSPLARLERTAEIVGERPELRETRDPTRPRTSRQNLHRARSRHTPAIESPDIHGRDIRVLVVNPVSVEITAQTAARQSRSLRNATIGYYDIW